jgi:hypothetical protein
VLLMAPPLVLLMALPLVLLIVFEPSPAQRNPVERHLEE